MSNLVYPKWKVEQLGGTPGAVDFDTDPIYLMLVTDTYVNTSTATLETHQYRSDVIGISGAEVTGTGYTAGGVQLAGCAVSASGTSAVFTATNPNWATSTITARGAVVYKRVGADLTTPADDPVVAMFDFGRDWSSDGGDFTVGLGSAPLTLA